MLGYKNIIIKKIKIMLLKNNFQDEKSDEEKSIIENKSEEEKENLKLNLSNDEEVSDFSNVSEFHYDSYIGFSDSEKSLPKKKKTILPI